eukprot:76153-Rhodomonas_salina.1
MSLFVLAHSVSWYRGQYRHGVILPRAVPVLTRAYDMLLALPYNATSSDSSASTNTLIMVLPALVVAPVLTRGYDATRSVVNWEVVAQRYQAATTAPKAEL